MPHDPEKPLLRLNNPRDAARRRSGGGGGKPRQFERGAQAQAHGPVFARLRDVLASPNSTMQLRADANSLAPERLLVFEVTGSVQDFAKAVARIPGLEFAGEEELDADALDQNPEFYLLVPQEGALNQIVSLWAGWVATGRLPRGFTPWRELFLSLKSVRPWGPSDRVTVSNRAYFGSLVEGAPDDALFRLEVELVFRPGTAASQTAQASLAIHIVAAGGAVIYTSRRPEFAYHAILADLPALEIRRIVALEPGSLAGADPVANIVPQSVGSSIEAGDRVQENKAIPLPGQGEPVTAVFDAVPVQAHPLLAGRIVIDDPVDLESLAVGSRIHGTAIASIAVHGDLNEPASPVSRRVYFRPVMYAPAMGNEIFDSDKLVIDVVVEAVVRMRAAGGTQVVVVNLSLGDSTKPFSGKISTWGRALDYLAFAHGVLFLVSAGNAGSGIPLADYATTADFEAVPLGQRPAAIFKALDGVKADRRILAPGDSVNALTVGAWHRDAIQQPFPGATPFAPYGAQEMPNLSSRLGLGFRRGTKPDVLFAGGRERVRLQPAVAPPVLVAHTNAGHYWGLKAAAPPTAGGGNTHFTVGTSAATALATHSAHRIFDAIEKAYPQVIGPMPLPQRAVLLKALLVHSASWRQMEDFIRPIIDPQNALHHEHWRREICRHLGYGFVDPDDAIACAGDRATMWATGEVGPEGSLIFDVPIPAVLGTSASVRSVRATLAWFTPIRPGHLAYRAIKLKVASLEDDTRHIAGVETAKGQPTHTQAESGTIVHRRWQGARIGNNAQNTVPVQVQREKDRGTPIDDPMPFALAVTVEMPGAVQVYDQVRVGIQLQPQVLVAA
jgi:hypothetical protein